MGETNYEKRAYAALEAVVLGKPWKHPGAPGGKASPNHRLFHAACSYAGKANSAGLEEATPGQRDRIIAIGHGQARPAPGERQGIGVVEGGFEQAPGDHHVAYHLLPTYAIALVAARRGDAEVLDLWRTVAGRWFALWRIGALPDGPVALPGSRFWPFKKQHPPVGPDGLVWKRPGETLSPVTDALYRHLAGLPQRDNRGRPQSWAWALRQRRQGFAALRALDALERATDAGVPLNLEPEVMVPVAGGTDTGATLRRRLYLTKTEEEIGGYIQGFAPAVCAERTPEGAWRIGWAPHRIPEGFTTGP